MLTYNANLHRQNNPLDFDFRSLTRCANLLLGKAKTDEFLKDSSPKGFLLLVGALELEAQEVRKDPKRAMPSDLPFKHTGDAAAELRWQAAQEIQHWRTLSTAGSLALNLSYRIRGANQFSAAFENEVTVLKSGQNPLLQLRVGLSDLKPTIEAAEKTGSAKIRITLDSDKADFTKNALGTHPINLTLQDELAERPENRRIWIGNIASRCEIQAKENGKLPADEAKSFTAPFSGKTLTLAKGCKAANVSEIKKENGKTTLEIELTFPEILQTLENNPKEDAAKGAITDQALRFHCANSYGCNGRDFVAATPEITRALGTNLRAATATWFNKEIPTQEDIQKFLTEYSTLAMTLRKRPKARTRLEPARSTIKSPTELTPSRPENPEHVYGGEISGQADANGFSKSCSSSAGPEWLDTIVEKELANSFDTDAGKTYSKNLETLFQIEDVARKQRLIEANFLRATPEILDGGPQHILLESPFLTPELEEEFQLKKEQADQDLFDSKSEAPKDEETGHNIAELDKREWLLEHGTLKLQLPNDPALLHRLTRYQNRRSSLGVQATRAERFDPEISMPTREFWKTPGKETGAITLADCLTEPAYKAIQELERNGDEAAIREIAGIKTLLEQWQSSMRKISPIGKNPFEARLWRWLEALAKGDEHAKCSSLQELSTLLGPSLSTCGKIPFENDRTPDHFQMPVRSNSLPLKLLCGTGQDELLEVHKDHAKLWDTVMRWQNADALNEEESTKKETHLLSLLETSLASENPNAITEHAITMELSQIPDYRDAYLKRIGLPDGLRSLPKELNAYGDILLPLNTSPDTTIVKGEETPMEELLTHLSDDGVKIALSPEEEQEVAKAPETALETWRRKCITSLQQLDKTDLASGEPAAITLAINLEPENPTGESDPFEDAIATLHEALPQSDGDLTMIAKVLLTHAPKNLTVNLLNETLTARRGSAGIWTTTATTTATSPAALSALHKIQEAEDAIAGKLDSPEAREAISSAAKAAHQTRMIHNVEIIPSALHSLPEHLKNQPNISELCQPLEMLAVQVSEAKKAEKRGKTLLAEWVENTPSEKDGVWGWEEEIILNPQGAVEMLCDAITGGDQSPTSDTEPKYFVRRLFSENEKREAGKRLASEGKQAAAFYLQETLNQNMDGVKTQAGQNFPELITALRTEIQGLLEKSHTPEVVGFFTKNPAIKQLLEDKTKYRYLEAKLRETVKELGKTKGKTTMGKTVTYDQIGRDILPGNGSRENLQVKIDPTGTQVQTNKLWAAAWLKSPLGAQNVQKRTNLANWIKSTEAKPKTAIAFLEFCRHRLLPEVANAIATDSLSTQEKQNVKDALKKFTGCLKEMGIDPDSASLSTQLHGALALNQYANNRFCYRPLWNYEWEGALEKIQSVDTSAPAKTMNVGIEKNPGKEAISISSPFKQQNQLLQGESPAEEIDQADQKTKLQSVIRAVGTLHKPIPFEKRHKIGAKNPESGDRPKSAPIKHAPQSPALA